SAPTGLVRGQLVPATTAEAYAAMRGSLETTVVDANARASVALSFSVDGTLHYVVGTSSPTPVAISSVRIERGAAGSDGPTELDLGIGSAALDATAATLTGDLDVPLALRARILQSPSSFHVNVRTPAAPNGICRGQLASGPLGFWAGLSGAEEPI